jgi:hypothetical protein
MNRVRTYESPFFVVLDHHLGKFGDIKVVSEEALKSYELSRFGDRVLCAKNAFSMRDWISFGKLMTNIQWSKFLMLSVTRPDLLYAKYQMFKYFRVFKA